MHINTSYGWRGGERQLYLLAQNINKKKIPQIVVCQPDSDLEAACTSADIPCLPIRMRGEWDWRARNEIQSLCLEMGVKIVHTHTAKAHSLAILAKGERTPFHLVVSRRVDFAGRSNWFSRWKYHSDKVDWFVSVSDAIKAILIRDGVNPLKVVTAYSGIDLNSFELEESDSLREEFSIPSDTLVIGNIAALVDHKDQETLIRAIASFETDVDYRLLIVGEGKLRKKLESLSRSLGVDDRVLFTGFRKDIQKFLSLFSIFTLTSKEEGLGSSVLDAMAAGLPVVGTRAGGIPEMVAERQGGYLAEVGDTVSIAMYFKKLLEDEKMRKSFGNFNKQRVKSFSVQETARKTEQVYFSLVGEELYQSV